MFSDSDCTFSGPGQSYIKLILTKSFHAPKSRKLRAPKNNPIYKTMVRNTSKQFSLDISLFTWKFAQVDSPQPSTPLQLTAPLFAHPFLYITFYFIYLFILLFISFKIVGELLWHFFPFFWFFYFVFALDIMTNSSIPRTVKCFFFCFFF